MDGDCDRSSDVREFMKGIKIGRKVGDKRKRSQSKESRKEKRKRENTNHRKQNLLLGMMDVHLVKKGFETVGTDRYTAAVPFERATAYPLPEVSIATPKNCKK